MAQPRLLSRLKRILPARRSHPSQGFTLLELLVVVVIAGGILTGLTYLVIQLMTADQRESSRAETQREMQLAMDYIATELREAVFVYTGTDLDRLVANYLSPSLSSNGSTPVLAFWKHETFPDPIKDACAGAGPPLATTDCLAGHSLALVVYSFSTADPSDIWDGRARITRAVISEYDSDGNPVSGYVNPSQNGISFEQWLINVTSSVAAARPDGNPTVLVDFVDDQPLPGGAAVQCPDDPATTAREYVISPTNSTARGFYACVSSATISNQQTGTASRDGEYQDVILYLRGSAVGRPGVITSPTQNDAEVLPTLETRALLRGIIERNPDSN